MVVAYSKKRLARSNVFFELFQNKTTLTIIGIIFSLIFLLRFRSYIVFAVIVLLAAGLNYIIHVTNLHIHLGHVAFLAIIFSYSLGFWYGVFTILIAHVVAEVLAGHADMEMIISAGVYTLLCFLATIFTNISIVTLGISLSILQAGLKFTLERFAGTPILELLTENGTEFIMLLFFFIGFAQPLVSIIL